MAHSTSLQVRSLLCSCAGFLCACVLAPPGLDEERSRLDEAGATFDAPYEERSIPDLPSHPTWPTWPTWRDALERAFLANGELEAAYFDWKAAVERVAGVAGYPNTNLAPSFGYLFSDESLKAWDRTTINVGFDAMENLAWPSKVKKAGEAALEEARAAGQRFLGAKFQLQRRVLEAWLDVALTEERMRITREDLELLRLSAETAAASARAGGMQRDLVAAELGVRAAENELRNLEAEARSQRALLNGMLARAPDAPLELPPALPEPRPLPVDDAAILAAGAHANPELAALAAEVAGREDALELARLAYLPDFNPFAGITGSAERMVGLVAVLPTTLPEIRSGIAEARARLREAQAMLRQARLERAASFVAALVVLRNAEREAAYLEGIVLPRAELLLETSRATYSAGTGRLLELIESERTLLEVRLSISEAGIERERRMAELEELAGADLETLFLPGSSSAPRTGSEKPALEE